MAGVLDGIRVFDLTLAAVGPWASKLLGQLGADVIHVEGPKPELAHHIPPEINGTGVLYITANYNKRNLVLDLKRPDDRATAARLVASCDVFVQNMRPGAVDKLGLGYGEVAAIRPDIVYVSASAYGRVGPMAGEAGVDPLLQAFCGWSSITGPPGSAGEMFRHYAHLDLTTSSMVVEAVLAALYHRARTGQGQHVEIEMLAAALSLQTTRLAEYFAGGAAGAPPEPMGSACPTTVPHQAFRCQEGRWLAIGVERDEHWQGLCRALGLPELAADPRLADNRGRVAQRAELIPRLEAHLATKPSAWWMLRLQREGVPHARPADFDDLRHHPQVLANGFIADIDSPHFGRIAAEGSPWRFSATPAVAVRAGGLPGEHTDAILAELAPAGTLPPAPRHRIDSDSMPRELGDLHLAGAPSAPLAGITVVDLSSGLAGPFGAARLGDLGARVIKVEAPSGDHARGHGPPFVGDDAAVFVAVNRNKSSLALDVDRPEGAALARRLLAAADIVIEDLAPVRRQVLGLDELGEDGRLVAYPRLVHVAVSAWGERGPLAGLAGAELPVQAMAEYLSSLGRIGEPPVRLGADVAGLNTGIFACQAALAGLVARDCPAGESLAPAGNGGQRVSVSQLGTLLHLRGIMWTARSNPDDWWGFHLDHYTNPPETGYRTADGQVLFGLRRGTSEDFDQLMIGLGLVDHITDPHFGGFGRDAAPLGRYAVEAKATWEQGFSSLSTDEVVALFHERGGDAVPFTDYPLITSHPQVVAIGALCEAPLPDGTTWRAVAPVWKLPAGPAAITGPAPRLGEHNDAILAQVGLSPAEVAHLRALGVIC